MLQEIGLKKDYCREVESERSVARNCRAEEMLQESGIPQGSGKWEECSRKVGRGTTVPGN